jgi:DNA polymerase-4
MIFHVDLDAFFASVEQRDNPRLRGKPILVGNTNPHGRRCHRGVVATCSYEARTFGVKSGMPIFEAQKLCPNAIIVSGHLTKYEEASTLMYQIFKNYTDQIEPVGLDEAFLYFWGFEEFYNYDLLTVAKNIKNEIKGKIGITASCGIAQNKIVAKIASGCQKPDGLTLVPCGYEKEFLAPLPIGKLYGIGHSIEGKLIKLGINTIGQLADLKKDVVKSLFGKYGQTLWLWANGIDLQELSPPPPLKSVGRSQTFPFNTSDLNFIKATLLFLCQKIASQLRQEKQKGKCVKTSIRYADFSFCSHQKKLCSPVFLAKEIYQISKDLLNEFWDKRPLRLVGVKISHFESQDQFEFETTKKERQEKLEKAVEKIRGKHGFWTIYPASLTTILPFEEKESLLHQR